MGARISEKDKQRLVEDIRWYGERSKRELHIDLLDAQESCKFWRKLYIHEEETNKSMELENLQKDYDSLRELLVMANGELKILAKQKRNLLQRIKEYSTFIDVTHQQESWSAYWLQQESGQKHLQAERRLDAHIESARGDI